MTAAQRRYLDTLAREAGEELPATLTKAEASEHIERLQKWKIKGFPRTPTRRKEQAEQQIREAPFPLFAQSGTRSMPRAGGPRAGRACGGSTGRQPDQAGG